MVARSGLVSQASGSGHSNGQVPPPLAYQDSQEFSSKISHPKAIRPVYHCSDLLDAPADALVARFAPRLAGASAGH
jgi:hypothetical protein